MRNRSRLSVLQFTVAKDKKWQKIMGASFGNLEVWKNYEQ